MMNVFDELARNARQWPTRPAIVMNRHALDYQSLWREIEALRFQLDRLGVHHGQGIGILMRNRHHFIIAAMAALGCGGVVMPLDYQLKAAELADTLTQVPLAVIMTDGSCPHQPEGVHHPLSLLDRTPLGFTRLAGRAATPLVPWIADPAFIRFTSGTTGAAKGVILTHQGVLERTQAANAGLKLGSEDAVLWVLPMAYHFFVSIVLYLRVGAAIVLSADALAVLERTQAANAGLKLGSEDAVLWVLPMAYHFFVSIVLYLRVGAAIVLSADALAESILAAATRHHVTFLYLAPIQVGLLAATASGHRLPSSLARVMSVSSRLPSQVAHDFQARHGLPVTQGYGVIEVGLPIMNLTEAAEHPEAIGRPLPGFEVAIVNDTMKPLTDGATGQLALRGPGMFAGYLNPPRSRHDVLYHGWFMTGDLARRDATGLVTIAGRCKSVVNVAGHKVFPEEVAAVLDEHPAVLRSRVTTRRHPRLGETVHADVQMREPRGSLAAEELLAFCRQRLSHYKVPASLAFVSEIELTPSGKVRHG